MSLDYTYVTCIGLRLEYRQAVKWCLANGVCFSEVEPACEDVEEAMAGLLKCHVEETGMWVYEGSDFTWFCICVNDSPRESEAMSSAAEITYISEYGEPLQDGVAAADGDAALRTKLMKQWSAKLEAARARAKKLGLSLSEPQIFNDLRLS
jgi:hypothetical protein